MIVSRRGPQYWRFFQSSPSIPFLLNGAYARRLNVHFSSAASFADHSATKPRIRRPEVVVFDLSSSVLKISARAASIHRRDPCRLGLWAFVRKGAATPGSPPRRCLILLARRSMRSRALALAGVREAVAMPAQEIAPRPVQLGDAATAGDAVLQRGR